MGDKATRRSISLGGGGGGRVQAGGARRCERAPAPLAGAGHQRARMERRWAGRQAACARLRKAQAAGLDVAAAGPARPQRVADADAGLVRRHVHGAGQQRAAARVHADVAQRHAPDAIEPAVVLCNRGTGGREGGGGTGSQQASGASHPRQESGRVCCGSTAAVGMAAGATAAAAVATAAAAARARQSIRGERRGRWPV